MAISARRPDTLDGTWSDLAPTPPYDDLRLRVLVACCHRLDRRWCGEHRHDPYDRLYVITEGSAGIMAIGGDEVVLMPGMTCLIPAFTPHRHRCLEGMTLYWTHFISRCDGERGLFDAVPGIHIRRPDRTAARACCERLLDACDAEGPSAVLTRQACILALIQPFLDLLAEGDDAERQRFRPVLAAIDAGKGDGAGGVARLAAIAGLSPDHFTRRFTAAFGTSPARFRRQRRLATAQRLLAEGDQSVDAIARACGFCDGFHLSKAFRGLLGTTPSAYRCRLRNP